MSIIGAPLRAGMARHRDAVAGLQDRLVPLHGTRVAREAVRARELAAPLDLLAVVAFDVDVDEHVRIHELKIRDRARDRDFLLGLEHARRRDAPRLRRRQQRRCRQRQTDLLLMILPHAASLRLAARAQANAIQRRAPRDEQRAAVFAPADVRQRLGRTDRAQVRAVGRDDPYAAGPRRKHVAGESTFMPSAPPSPCTPVMSKNTRLFDEPLSPRSYAIQPVTAPPEFAT